VLSSAEGPVAKDDILITQIYQILGDKNWRVRHATLTLLPQLAQQMKMSDFNEAFAKKEFFTNGATDNCALIRIDFVRVCAEVAQVYGTPWLLDTAMACILKCGGSPNYQLKLVTLDAIAQLGGLLKGTPTLEDELLPMAFDWVTDKVPNLRLHLGLCLGAAAKGGWVEKDSNKDKLKEVLLTLSSDADMDVKTNATAASDHIA
jgi:hypothetical protein